MSFEKFYFYQHNIRLVRLHKSAEFTTFTRISAIFCCDGCRHLLIYHDQTIPTPSILSTPFWVFHLFHALFLSTIFPPIYPSSCVQWYVVFSVWEKRKPATSLLYYRYRKTFFLLGAYFFILFILFYFRYPLCVYIGNVLGLDL